MAAHALATTRAKDSEKLAIGWGQQKGVKLFLPRANFDDPAQHSTIIQPGLAVALREIGLQSSHLLVGQPNTGQS